MSQSPDQPKRPARAANAAAPSGFEAEMLALLPQLRRYSRSLTRSDSEGEDLLQDCMEKALVNRSQWRGTNLKAWACRIMTNLHLNARRAVSRRPAMALDDAAEIAEEPHNDDLLMNRRLRAALDTLPAETRAVLMLVVVEGYTYREVAEMLAIPQGTVMSRLSRARQSLREKINTENVIPMRRP